MNFESPFDSSEEERWREDDGGQEPAQPESLSASTPTEPGPIADMISEGGPPHPEPGPEPDNGDNGYPQAA